LKREEKSVTIPFLKVGPGIIQLLTPGLPDFSWYVIPKPEKCTKSTQNVPNSHKISQMTIKISNVH
jgi:hypothetical protein